MSEASELLEHMEHVGHSGGDHGGGHGGHGSGGPGKMIGVTMAMLGVLLALCAAMVGSERTELIRTMVEQSTKWGIYQSETTKFRVIEGDLEVLKALTPSKEEADQLDRTLRSKRASSGKADDEDTAELKDLIASSMDDMADLLAPDKEDVDHFKKLARTYEHDVKEAKEDAEAYEGAVEAHGRASELYERAQLAVEIGIVIASIALMMGSKKVWAVSVVCGVAGLVLIGYTAVTTHAMLEKAEDAIREAAKREQVMEADEDGDDDKPAAANEKKKDETNKGPEAKAEAKADPKADSKGEGKVDPKNDTKVDTKPSPKPATGAKGGAEEIR